MIEYFISDFKRKRPLFTYPQKESLRLLALEHVAAEKKRNPQLCEAAFHEKMQQIIAKVACKEEHISHRGHSVENVYRDDSSKECIYDTKYPPAGVGFSERTRLFQKH
ncbi:MAG: hypothetical protein ACKVOH_06845, partial [Chlamydiales bacterium]